jgi:hypothetical protein
MNGTSTWTWLGDHLAVDFANTTIGLDGRREELIGTIEEFRGWIEAEPVELPSVEDGEIDMELVRAQRDATGRLLRAAALGLPLPAADITLINARVVEGGVARLLTGEAGASQLVAGRGFSSFLGVLAGATVVFHRSRRNQRWCSPGCGNRARVDRHRHRNPASGTRVAR